MILASTIIFITFLGSGILFRVFKRVEALAGYDERKVTDKDGLAIWVGNICLRASCFYGIVTTCLWLSNLDMTLPRVQAVGFLIVFAPILAVVITLLSGFDRFMKPPGTDS